MKPWSRIFPSLFLVRAFSTAAIAGQADQSKDNCQAAESFFQVGMQAGKESNWNEATTNFKKSAEQCNKFDNWYMLGQAEFYARNYQAASDAYIESRKYANNDDTIALSIARYAEVQSMIGKKSEASNLLHDARKLHSEPPAWISQLALAVDTELSANPVTKDTITRAFTELPPKSFHKYQPEVALRLNFKFDNAELIDEDAHFDASAIAEALNDPRLREKTFTLVGHSDIRGDSSYNESLSMKRAKTIKKALMAIDSSLDDRIIVEGMGEREPLYDGDSEQIHLFNRRVELSLNVE